MDGAAVDDTVRIFVAGNLQTGNFNLTRLCYMRGEDQWFYFDVEAIVVSTQPGMIIGDRPGAIATYQLALEIFEELKAPEAREVRATLDELESGASETPAQQT